MRSFHFQARKNKTDCRGRPALGLGMRIGFWPCLQAIYLQVEIGSRNFSLWYGYPPYQNAVENNL